MKSCCYPRLPFIPRQIFSLIVWNVFIYYYKSFMLQNSWQYTRISLLWSIWTLYRRPFVPREGSPYYNNLWKVPIAYMKVACGADAISRNVPPAGKLSVCEPERRFDFHDVMPLSQFNQLNVTLYHRHMQLEFSTRGSWLRVTNEGVIYYSSSDVSRKGPLRWEVSIAFPVIVTTYTGTDRSR
jgi:hypothetical protein